MFQNAYRPIGLWIFGFFILSNLICIAELCTVFNLIKKDHIPIFVKGFFIITFILEIYLMWRYDDYWNLINKENKKGQNHNIYWMYITYIYISLSILLIIITVMIV